MRSLKLWVEGRRGREAGERGVFMTESKGLVMTNYS